MNYKFQSTFFFILLSLSIILLIQQIPKAAPDPLAKEREDVNKLVSDLIGGGAAPASSSKSPTPKATVDSPAKEPQKQVTPSSSGRSKPVKLVVDQLAPVNIRPKVRILHVATSRHCSNSNM